MEIQDGDRPEPEVELATRHALRSRDCLKLESECCDDPESSCCDVPSALRATTELELPA